MKGPKEMGAGLLAIAAVFLAWKSFWPTAETARKEALRLQVGTELPIVGLARLYRTTESSQVPSRDVFKFGRDEKRDLMPVPTPVIALDPLPTAMLTPEAPPTPTPWPVLNVSLIGIVDNGVGRRVGSFVKDGDTLLVGGPGQVLGNAIRVIRVNTESAEIEELGSGRTRRLPLKNN